MSEKLYTCIATCGKCGRELNRAEHVPERARTQVIISAPLVCICPVPAHNVYSDCNVGVELKWVEEINDASLRPDTA